MIASLIDSVLDQTVVPGYTRLGFQLRHRLWDRRELGTMAGTTVLITGATSGLGLAAAEGFARLGARLLLVGRDAGRGERARKRIEATSPGSQIELGACDLGDLGSVRRYAEKLAGEGVQIDVLVNNAGVMLDERTLSADGVELTFATNVLGPFLLTNLLTDAAGRSPAGRILSVSSGGMYTQRLHADDLQMAHEDYDGTVAYARSKRAEVILTELWAKRLAATRITAHSMHPGWADTPGLRDSLPGFYRVTKLALRSAEEGADTIVWLGAAPDALLGSGGFWHDRRRRPTHRVPWTRESEADRELLWSECARLSGWQDPWPGA